jgi:hypothetical protein
MVGYTALNRGILVRIQVPQPMKKKIVIIGLIVLVVAAAAIGIYFAKHDKPPADTTEQNTAQPQTQIITDDFSIDLPSGWEQTTAVTGTSAMAFNANEVVDDPAAEKIGFKTYFAVSPDTLQEESMDKYFQALRGALLQSVPDVVFTKEQDITINGNSAHAIEAELTQQEANFKILMVVISGQEKDLWVLSFNATKSSWGKYEEIFYNLAKSFVFKK